MSLEQFGTIVHALVASAAITVAWYASMQSFRSACRPAQAALGQAGSTGLASLGVFAVSALALWVPWLSIRPLTVVQVAAAVFVLQLAWESSYGPAPPSGDGCS